VIYTPEWESIREALERIRAAGVSEKQAKRNLCRAMAERRVDVRLTTVGKNPSQNLPELTFEHSDISPRLSPRDIAWSSSRASRRSTAWGPKPHNPAQPISFFTQRAMAFADRVVALIEVRSAQVTRIFLCGSEKLTDISPPTAIEREAVRAASPPTNTPDSEIDGAMVIAASEVIQELWPNGVKGVKTDDRLRMVNERLVFKSKSRISKSTILRALRRLKAPSQSV
jgi:hypothetical protein